VQAATSAAQLLGPPVSFGLRVVRVKILMLSGNGRPLALAPPGRDQVQLEPREAAAGCAFYAQPFCEPFCASGLARCMYRAPRGCTPPSAPRELQELNCRS
jgi:hypothetical protein